MKFSLNPKYRKFFVALCAAFCISGVLAEVKAQDLTPAPPVGETVDLLSFRSRSGQTLAEALQKHRLAMLVLVDPNCGTCTATKDSMNALRERVQTTRIAYFVVMIGDGSETQKYFEYADSLK